MAPLFFLYKNTFFYYRVETERTKVLRVGVGERLPMFINDWFKTIFPSPPLDLFRKLNFVMTMVDIPLVLSAKLCL